MMRGMDADQAFADLAKLLPPSVGPIRMDAMRRYQQAVVRWHDLARCGQHNSRAAASVRREVEAALRGLSPGEKAMVRTWTKKRFGVKV